MVDNVLFAVFLSPIILVAGSVRKDTGKGCGSPMGREEEKRKHWNRNRPCLIFTRGVIYNVLVLLGLPALRRLAEARDEAIRRKR